MSAHRYYTLVASLPALPYFKQAERLPINRQRLEERLRLLTEKDAHLLAKARAIVEWGAHSANRTDPDFIRKYEEFRAICDSPSLRSTVLYRINLRTVLAALRRRLRGEENGPANPAWGIGDWKAHIEINWRVPDFKLGHLFPWISKAQQQLENGESAALEGLLMDLVWQNLSRSALGYEFQFESVIAFVFKWDILERWLSFESESARSQFSQIGAEILSEPALATA